MSDFTISASVGTISSNSTSVGTISTNTPLYTTSTIGNFDPNTCTVTTTKRTNHPELDPFSYYFNGNKYSFTSEGTTITPSKLPFDFENIKEIVPEKVYEFTFHDGEKVKTIREEEDPFDLEYMFYLAIAKKLYSKDYTFDGVLYKAYQLDLEKKYVKAVKKGIKLFNKLKEEQSKQEEQKAIKKRQHEKYIKKKKAAKERKRKDQVNIIAEAIRLSKEEG